MNLSPVFIDFHAHLDAPEFDLNRILLIDQCVSSGIGWVVNAANPADPESLRKADEMIRHSPSILAVVGAHPHQADDYTPETESRILQFMKNDAIIGVGEVGLDFHYKFAERQAQIRVFRRQIAIAKEARIPLVLHSRKAEKEILEILGREKCDVPVVFHCYTGGREEADEIVRRGYFISIAGIVTFKNAMELRAIVRETPLSNLLTETDSPYLAPEPFRGKPNSPLLIKTVAERIAEIKEIPLIELTQSVERNLRSLR